MECVSGMWSVEAGLRQLFRGVEIYKGLLFRLRLQSCSWVLSGQCSRFLCWGPLRPLALGGDLIRSFILAASFPEEKGTGWHRLFILFGARGSGRRLVAGSWEGLGSGGSKWGADTVPCVSVISHLLRVPGVSEVDFGLFRKFISRPRKRPSMEVGVGVSEPPSLLGCGKLALYLIL